MINNAMWQSEKPTALSLRHRMLWIGLITTSDDQGRGRAHPGLVRAAVFPLEDVTLDEISDGLQAFAEQEMVVLYEAEDKAIYQIVKWWDYQGKMSWAWPSEYPPPPEWQDRVKHRQGNNVVETNWEQDASDPTVTSPQPRNEPTPTCPPNINGNGNSNINGNGNVNGNRPSPHTIREVARDAYPELRLTVEDMGSLDRAFADGIISLDHLSAAMAWSKPRKIVNVPQIIETAMGWRDFDATGPPGMSAADRAAENMRDEEEE